MKRRNERKTTLVEYGFRLPSVSFVQDRFGSSDGHFDGHLHLSGQVVSGMSNRQMASDDDAASVTPIEELRKTG